MPGDVLKMLSTRYSKNMEILAATSRIMVQFFIPQLNWVFPIQGIVWHRTKPARRHYHTRSYTSLGGWSYWAQRTTPAIAQTETRTSSKQNEILCGQTQNWPAVHFLERVGTVAYRLELPADTSIHLVFHVSQLKPFHPNFTPVFSTLPMLIDIEAAAATPNKILDRRLVKKGNNAITQILVSWTGLPSSSVT